MEVCVLWVFCVVTDHSSRGVLPTVVRRCVWSRNLVNEEAMAHWGLWRHPPWMGWVVNTTFRPLYPRERPGAHCIGGWVGLRTGLDRWRKSRPPSGFDPRILQIVASRCIDWAIPASTLQQETTVIVAILRAGRQGNWEFHIISTVHCACSHLHTPGYVRNKRKNYRLSINMNPSACLSGKSQSWGRRECKRTLGINTAGFTCAELKIYNL